jgi:hypothetical protein
MAIALEDSIVRRVKNRDSYKDRYILSGHRRFAACPREWMSFHAGSSRYPPQGNPIICGIDCWPAAGQECQHPARAILRDSSTLQIHGRLSPWNATHEPTVKPDLHKGAGTKNVD